MLEACQRTLKISKVEALNRSPGRPDSILLGAPFRVPLVVPVPKGPYTLPLWKGGPQKTILTMGLGDLIPQ